MRTGISISIPICRRSSARVSTRTPKASDKRSAAVFSEQYGIYVITMLFYNMRHTWNWGMGRGMPEATHHEDMVAVHDRMD